jgi:hypothetical protein
VQTLIFGSDRQFQIWKYIVGHRQLLVRSVKSADNPTRIDVLFKGVSQFHLPTILRGLFIAEGTETEIRESFLLQQSAAEKKGLKVFTVRGVDFVGYVTALIVATHEDEGEYYDPSFFRSLMEQ